VTMPGSLPYFSTNFSIDSDFTPDQFSSSGTVLGTLLAATDQIQDLCGAVGRAWIIGPFNIIKGPSKAHRFSPVSHWEARTVGGVTRYLSYLQPARDHSTPDRNGISSCPIDLVPRLDGLAASWLRLHGSNQFPDIGHVFDMIDQLRQRDGG